MDGCGKGTNAQSNATKPATRANAAKSAQPTLATPAATPAAIPAVTPATLPPPSKPTIGSNKPTATETHRQPAPSRSTTVNELRTRVGPPGSHVLPPVPPSSKQAATVSRIAPSQPARCPKTGQDIVDSFPPLSLNRSTPSQPAPVSDIENRPPLPSNQSSTGESRSPFPDSSQFDGVMDEDPYFDKGGYDAPYSEEMYDDGKYGTDSGGYMNYNHHEAPYNPSLRYPTNSGPPRGYPRYPRHAYPHGPMRYPPPSQGPGPQPHPSSTRPMRYQPGYGLPRSRVASNAGPSRAPASSNMGRAHSQTLPHGYSDDHQYGGSSGQYGQEEGNRDDDMLS